MGFLLIILLNIIFSFPFLDQNDRLSDSVLFQLERFMNRLPQEKVYLHLDKPHYMAGDDLWYKAYMVVGTNQMPDTLNTVLYVELINPRGKIIDQQNIKIIRGSGWGDFNLPYTLPPGEYIIKAYTSFMQNYDPSFLFRKRITILERPSQKASRENQPENPDTEVLEKEKSEIRLDLSFFPEGGDMVDNLVNYVAFKSSLTTGKGISIKGIILNSADIQIAEFESNNLGMGMFRMIPNTNTDYRARVEYLGEIHEFPLPERRPEGYVMHISRDQDKLILSVQNNMEITMDKSFVIGQMRGTPFLNLQAQEGRAYLYTSLNIDQIPSGVAQFAFFDGQGIPQCERLVFIDNPTDQVALNFESNEKEFNTREKATLKFNANDVTGNPVTSNLSVGITNVSLVNPEDIKSNIYTYLLLESDLKGTIEDPAHYFDPRNESRNGDLDILMMTHGWRRFVWKDVLADSLPPMKYYAENGFTLEGNLYRYYNTKKPIPGYVSLFMYQDQFTFLEVASDDEGRFMFSNLDINDSTDLILQARKIPKRVKEKDPSPKDKVKDNIHISMFNREQATITYDYWPPLFQEISPETEEKYQEQNEYILKLDSAFDGRTIILEGVMVKDSRIEDEDLFEFSRNFYLDPDNQVVMDSMPDYYDFLTIFDILQRQVPGILVIGTPPFQAFSFSRRTVSLSDSTNQAPLVLWNGVPTDIQGISHLTGSEIEYVDVLKGPKAAMFGSRGTYGVVAIYTRTDLREIDNYESDRGITNLTHPGYYRAREFYTPDYSVPDEKHAKPDYRSTLYWNPQVLTDEAGETEFSFYTSDEKGTYCMQVQGITNDGRPVTGSYFFNVE